MSIPAVRDLRNLYRGDDYFHEITAVDDNNQAIDLSDRTWAAQWRPFIGAERVVEFAVDDTEAVNGILHLSLTATQTASLSLDGVWDLAGIYIADGVHETFMKGDVYAHGDVTQ